MNLPHPDTSTRRAAAILLGALAVTCLVPRAWAQPTPSSGLPQPRLLMVHPAGGQAGVTLEITLTGNDLDEPEKLLFSHPAITAQPVGQAQSIRPATPPQAGQPPLMTARFKVTVPPEVPPGSYDVRFVSKAGISNPRAFVVGDLPEVTEKEPNSDVDQAQEIALNSTAHGAITTPTDVDYFRFAGRKGQRIVVSCLASSIDSKLQAAVALYDRAGTMLASNHGYRDSDALLDCALPEDGPYLVRVCSFAYLQGTAEHFYRLTVSTAPWIDAVFPPLVEPGKEAKLTVYGRNLPGGALDPDAVIDGRVLEKMTVTVNAPDGAALHRLIHRGYVPPVSGAMDGFEYRVRNEVGLSNPFLLTYARAPIVLDSGNNDTAEKAQAVSAPCEIVGRIERKRDRDWYRFVAKKGEVLSIELYGDRLGSPLDLYAVLKSAGPKGPTLVELDDNPEPVPNQFFARSNDPPRYRFKAPADGTYLLKVTSREADMEGGPHHLYRARITPESPDFRLVLMPSAVNAPDACNIRRGATGFFTAFVTPIDGFNGEITLTAEGLPEGVSCPPQTIPPGQKQGVLVVSAAEDAPLWAGEIRVKGTATIGDSQVEREARAATITWPLPQNQVAPAISRLDGSLVLAVAEQGPFVLAMTRTTATARPGTKVTIPLKLTRSGPDFKGPVQVSVFGLPGNPQQQPKVTIPAGKTAVEAVVDVRPNVPPGLYTVVFRGQADLPLRRGSSGKQKQNVTVVLPSSPLTLTVKAAR